MFLKSLTLKGFKSFADKTSLEFEPGVTVVVGPNGSGKSNLVDAVAWVLGAQGPRTMRSGKMDDVIFAGTPQRPALGRAEVALTIDNAAGLLPIEFSEVTITRTLFRTGDSEYQINGAPCRLLDIQELLSDTGIGRQQHVIVGQGQLDTVLNARPEDRRAIIEEAAGVLKYRKRRERAERRLEATEGNLLRLQDLLREVRRQLTPLQRQADAARRHDGLAAELRAIRLHLIGHEIAGLQSRHERLHDQRAQLATSDSSLRGGLRDLDLAVVDVERSLSSIGDEDLAEWLVRVESLRERARGLRALVAEKERGVAREFTAAADEGVVETLVADAATARAQLVEVEAEAAALVPRVAEVEEAERQVRADRERLGARPDVGSSAVEEPANGPALEEAATVAVRARVAAEDALRRAEADWRSAEADAGHWRARAEALGLALQDARAGTGARQLADIEGVVGPLVDQLEIEQGVEAAVLAVLGDAMQAIVVQGGAAARAALQRLKEGDTEALLLVTGSPGVSVHGELVPAGTRLLAECVRASSPAVEAALSHVLAGVVLVEGGWRTALDLALANPGLVAVTPDGDRLGGRALWRAGGERHRGVTQGALDEAMRRATETEAARATAEARASAARSQLEQVELDTASREATRRSVLAELARHESAAATLRRDLEVRAAGLEERRAVLARRLGEVEERLARNPEAQAAAEERRAGLTRKRHVLATLAARLTEHLDRVEAVHERLRERRRVQSEEARESTARLDALRSERVALEKELAGVRERQSRSEVEEAETRLRLETAVEKLRGDFDCEPAAALDAPAPEVPAGTTLTARARELERELRLMGPINPLALEEYDALQERHTFLQSQLEDVKQSRRELMRVIKAVDHEIVTVFEAAFEDVRQHFADLFATLFPGGFGRVFLTDPDDVLNTGVEIEARPSGKNLRRLSLLSGGERSLTALAYLFAVFRARPSPFYLLDEVEAALDDVNLHRFLDLVHEFRDEAQLVIVSHQKRTMEAADCLYGVTMPPGGSSRVVSQRMREQSEPEDALVLP